MRHPKRNTTFAMPTRRGILQSGAAVAGLALAGTSLLPSRAHAAPKRGGTLRVAKGHGATTDTLDPATWTHGFEVAMTYGINGYLTSIGKDGSAVSELAETWEPTPDARIWRAKLRPGVTYHDGRAVTVEDVVNSINHHRKEDSTSAAKSLVAAITNITTEGDTVVFELESGNADFPVIFVDYHFPILPADGDTIDWKSGNGCGPYKLASFQPGVSATFTRNENDWNQDRGWYAEIEMLAVIDLNARTTALVSGDVQAIDRLDLKTVGLLGRSPNINIQSVPGNQHYTFAMSTTKDPFTDANVRRAVKHAVNREELVEKILFGYGSVGNDHPIGRGQRFYNDELAQTPYDPDKAKFYLKEAGMDGLKIDLSAAEAAFAGSVDAAVLFQNSAAPAGIEINVNRVPNDGYWSDVWMQDSFASVYWSGRATEDAMFTLAYSSGAEWNDTFWDNAQFNELLVSARAELDEPKRRQMYYEMQAILNDDGGAVIPMFANWAFATSSAVNTGEGFESTWDMDGERWMERWSEA